MYRWITTRNTNIVQLTETLGQAYAIIDKDNNTLLYDTAPRFLLPQLQQSLKKLSQTHTLNICAIVLSHLHHDHCANANHLANKYNCPVFCHPESVQILQHQDDFSSQQKNKYRNNIQGVNDGEILNLPHNAHCKIIHTPGHSYDSLCLIIDDEICTTGDALMGLHTHERKTDPAENFEQSVQSWKKLLSNTDPSRCLLFLPGHGYPIQRKQLEQNDYLLEKIQAV